MASTCSTFEGFEWDFAPAAPEALCQRLSRGHWGAEAEVLKRNRRRTIYRVPGAPGLIIKHDRPPSLRDRLKSLWRHAGRREYEATLLGHERGLPLASPVGVARRGSETLYAALELAGCVTLREAWARAQSDSAWRERLLAGLATFASRFACARVAHPDMHAGNILVREEPARAECYLVDMAGARGLNLRSPMPVWEAAGWVTQLAPSLSRQEALSLLAAAGVVPVGDCGMTLWLALLRRSGLEAVRRWPGRRKRLLTSSSLCELLSGTEGLWRLYRPFTVARAQAALRQHDANVAAGALLKNDRKRRLSRVVVDSQALVVKEFLAPGHGPWRADRRSWMNHYRLNPKAFPVCRCYAWLRGRDRGVLVLEDVGRMNLQQACQTAPAAERRRLLAAAMRLLAALHALGTLPRDMKATNIMVCAVPGGPAPVSLVDADTVRFGVTVRSVQRAGNLFQFLDNLPPEVCWRERLRALVAYRRESGISRDGLRNLLGDWLRSRP